MNGTFEIFTNKEWMILPSFVHGILPTVIIMLMDMRIPGT